MERREFISTTAAAMAALTTQGWAETDTSNDMPYRVLGKTGAKVSLIGIGGYHLGEKNTSDDTAMAIVRGAIDRGVNFMDNAWDYNKGRSEDLMGRALLDGYRDKVFLMTKHHGRNIRTARKHLEESLRRLHTDYLDLWQFHQIESMKEVNKIYSSGVLEYVQKKKDEGVIKHIGFTGHTHPSIHRAMIEKGFEWETVQMPVNVLDQHYRSFAKEIIPLLLKRNIGIIGMKSLAFGAIVEHNIAPVEDCLRFAMSTPASTVVSGITNMKQLEQNIGIAKNFKPMTADEIAKLLEKTYDAAQGGKHEWYKDKS